MVKLTTSGGGQVIESRRRGCDMISERMKVLGEGFCLCGMPIKTMKTKLKHPCIHSEKSLILRDVLFYTKYKIKLGFYSSKFAFPAGTTYFH